MTAWSDPASWLQTRVRVYGQYAELVAEQAEALYREDFQRITELDQERERLALGPLAEAAPAGLEAALARSPRLAALMQMAQGELARVLELDKAYQRGLQTVMEAARAELAGMTGRVDGPKGYRSAPPASGTALDLTR